MTNKTILPVLGKFLTVTFRLVLDQVFDFHFDCSVISNGNWTESVEYNSGSN